MIPRLMAVFLLLGLFAWWIFRSVSLPPLVRSLFEEDQAMATAATPATAEEGFQQELNKLPLPSQEHAPEVAALLQRLRSIPAIPYLLQVALQRDATAPKGETPQAWNEAELQVLRDIQTAYLVAWEPFLSGPAPDWPRFPDSILLFRSQCFLLEENKKIADLMTYQPGQASQRTFTSDPLNYPEFFVSLMKQCRGMGAIRFGSLEWKQTETIAVAGLTYQGLEKILISPQISLEALESLRETLAPAPDVLEIQGGLAADRALFLRTADYLESLPSSTSAKAGLTRWLQNESDANWYLQRAGNPAYATELGSLLRRDTAQLEILRQKTFLPGPGWRQWLSGDPGAKLSPLLAQGLGGFTDFEKTRTTYLFIQATLDARIALEKGGLEAARRIPDPTRPGAFLQAESTPEGVRIATPYLSEGETNAMSFMLPSSSSQSP